MSNRRKTGSNAARNRSGKHEEKARLVLGDMEKNMRPESQDPIAKITEMLEIPTIMEVSQKTKEFLDIKVIYGTENKNTWEKLSNI